jgi:hypothetical protein
MRDRIKKIGHGTGSPDDNGRIARPPERSEGRAQNGRWHPCHELSGPCNLAFSGWEGIFKDAMMTAAAIDRLVHHCVIVELNVTGQEGPPDSSRDRTTNG